MGTGRRSRYPCGVSRATLRAPDWEPYSRRLVLRATPRQVHELDVLAAELGVTRAWLLRRAVARGLPDVVADLRSAEAASLRVAGPTRRLAQAVRDTGAGSPVAVVLVETGGTVAPRKRRRVPPQGWD